MPAVKPDVNARTKEILRGQPEGAFVLLGKEEFLKRRFISDLTEKYITDDLCRTFDYIRLEGDASEADLFTALDSPPQFAEKKVVVLSGTSPERNAKQNRDFITAAVKKAVLCENLCFLCAFYDEEIDAAAPESRSFITALKASSEVLIFDPMPKAKLSGWTRRHFTAAGTDITEGAVLAIVEAAACDMTAIRSETEKLIAYAGENGLSEVTEAEVKAVVARREVYDPYCISSALSARDFDTIHAYLSDARRKKVEPVILLSMFSREAERLLSLSLAKRGGKSTADAAKALGMHEYPVKLKYELLSRMAEEAPARIADACYRADLALKTAGGGYDTVSALASEIAYLMK